MKLRQFASFIFIIILICTFSINGFAQVGINTITPDSSASLHIVSKPSGSGLIIPELTEAQRLAIAKPAKGLMVFDLDANLFYMNMDTAPGNQWYAINPFLTKGSASTADVMYTSSVVTKVGIGTSSPQATLDVNGDTHTKGLSVDGFSTNALVPTGGIMMWSGDPSMLPAGWALCDGATIGSFVTPDLRGRFIVGFDKNASAAPAAAPTDGTSINYGAVKNTGGEVGHLLDTLETALVRHSHVSEPHQHILDAMIAEDNRNSSPYYLKGADQSIGEFYTAATKPATVTINAVAGQNASKPHENRPPYYVLAYIIKLP